jgi:16S rRNA C967 or C1407 C5-methylase (RsmB/RsmF family)
MLSFRDYHTLQILESYSQSSLPLDALLRNYLRLHKAIGSKDRNVIAQKIYFIIRNLSLIDHQISHPVTWEKRILFINSYEPKNNSSLPLHIQYSCPKWLFDILKLQYNEPVLEKILKVSNTEAPLTIRVNTLKTTPENLETELKKEFTLIKCSTSPLGFKFTKREPITSHPLFKQGFFEIQDEASQMAILKLDIIPGQHVLDYCAGAGGKSLAAAPFLQNKGLLYLHDIRSHAIKEAQKRFLRAGINNAQFFDPIKPLPANLKQKMDWIILDVPCSGTGTLRRNPDLKWKITPDSLSRLIKEQQKIFDEAYYYLKPGGKIVYSTCSILEMENMQQTLFFLEKYPSLKKLDELILLPEENSHDGFYSCILWLDDKRPK